MNFVFDVLLLGIIAAGAYLGIKYGFISIAAKPIKFVASLVFALSLCSGVGKAVIAPMIQAPISNYIKEFMYSKCEGLTPDNVATEIPTLLKMSGAAFNVDIGAASGVSADQILDNVIFKLTSPFVNVVSILAAFVVLLFVGKLLITLGIYLVNRFCDGGILAKINKSMGFVLAGFLALLCAWTFVCITQFFFHLPIFNNSVAIQNFNGGFIYRLFSSISPLELLLSF